MHNSTHAARGFTLIEVMVVVAIIAILSAIAYPSYQEQVARGKRSDAKGELLEHAQWMERQVSVSGTYAKTAAGTAITSSAAELPALKPATAAVYDMSFTATPTASDYTLRLIPKTGGAMANDKCGTFSITNTGERTASGTLGTADCWNR